MASAYTPGLTVSSDIVVRRVRRLPIKGEVIIKQGDQVTPEQVIAQAMLPGPLQTLKLADKLGVEPKDVLAMAKIQAGDSVSKGQVVAEKNFSTAADADDLQRLHGRIFADMRRGPEVSGAPSETTWERKG